MALIVSLTAHLMIPVCIVTAMVPRHFSHRSESLAPKSTKSRALPTCGVIVLKRQTVKSDSILASEISISVPSPEPLPSHSCFHGFQVRLVADGRIRTDAHDPLAPLILTTLTQGPALPLPLLAAIAIIGTGLEGLAFVVLSLRSTRRRCPSFVLILALWVYAEQRAELNER
jgi:hypothetical protein